MGSTVGEARGILKRPGGAGRFHHVRHAPSSRLAGIVQHYWIVRWELQDAGRQVAETLPHPNVHLALEPGQSRVVGIQTGRFTRTLKGRGRVFGVKFRAGAFRPFLQESVSTLRNRSLPLHQVFDSAAAPLEIEVLAERDDRHMIDIVERFLAERLPPPDPNVERAAAVVDHIADDRSITAVEQLTGRWRLSKRSLQRLFNEYVGVGPKWVINRYRLHEAVERLAAQAPPNWADLALELGYFDQAHFIRDFKTLVGCTPAAYARGRGAGGP